MRVAWCVPGHGLVGKFPPEKQETGEERSFGDVGASGVFRGDTVRISGWFLGWLQKWLVRIFGGTLN